MPLLAVARQRRRTRSHLVAYQAQSENIGLRQIREIASQHLLGQVAAIALRDVVATAAHGSDREAQVGDLVAPVLARASAHEDVIRLYVQVHKVAAVEDVEAVRDISENLDHLLGTEPGGRGILPPPLDEPVAQRALAELRLDMEAAVLEPGREVPNDVRTTFGLHGDVGQGEDLAELDAPKPPSGDLRCLLHRVDTAVDAVPGSEHRRELALPDDRNVAELTLQATFVLVASAGGPPLVVGKRPSAEGRPGLRRRGLPQAKAWRPWRAVLHGAIVLEVLLGVRHDFAPRHTWGQKAVRRPVGRLRLHQGRRRGLPRPPRLRRRR
mmetsp:Transcript_61609/g.174039  ORF Transcript_61609/g.174039 Transcript_61609/m.174039 type:complete len:325 (+) Transcript_61609:516-1490(+)